MREPQPALVLLLFQGLALLALGGWWLSLPVPERHVRLLHLWQAEHIATLPPADVLAQGQWLAQHRWERLQGWRDLLLVVALIGLIEGWERRRRHPWGGFGFARLALGHWGLVIGMGATAASLVWPWPLPSVGTAGVLSGVVGLSGYLLAGGAPRLH